MDIDTYLHLTRTFDCDVARSYAWTLERLERGCDITGFVRSDLLDRLRIVATHERRSEQVSIDGVPYVVFDHASAAGFQLVNEALDERKCSSLVLELVLQLARQRLRAGFATDHVGALLVLYMYLMGMETHFQEESPLENRFRAAVAPLASPFPQKTSYEVLFTLAHELAHLSLETRPDLRRFLHAHVADTIGMKDPPCPESLLFPTGIYGNVHAHYEQMTSVWQQVRARIIDGTVQPHVLDEIACDLIGMSLAIAGSRSDDISQDHLAIAAVNALGAIGLAEKVREAISPTAQGPALFDALETRHHIFAGFMRLPNEMEVLLRAGGASMAETVSLDGALGLGLHLTQWAKMFKTFEQYVLSVVESASEFPRRFLLQSFDRTAFQKIYCEPESLAVLGENPDHEAIIATMSEMVHSVGLSAAQTVSIAANAAYRDMEGPFGWVD